ncbi:MAG: hypothetical protein ACOX23_09430 [Peptococcia bacterium]
MRVEFTIKAKPNGLSNAALEAGKGPLAREAITAPSETYAGGTQEQRLVLLRKAMKSREHLVRAELSTETVGPVESEEAEVVDGKQQVGFR